MKQDQWDKMSNKEKFDYISGKQISIISRSGLNANAKVNDDPSEKIITRFIAECEDVYISNWQDSSYEAMKEAVGFLGSLLKPI